MPATSLLALLAIIPLSVLLLQFPTSVSTLMTVLLTLLPVMSRRWVFEGYHWFSYQPSPFLSLSTLFSLFTRLSSPIMKVMMLRRSLSSLIAVGYFNCDFFSLLCQKQAYCSRQDHSDLHSRLQPLWWPVLLFQRLSSLCCAFFNVFKELENALYSAVPMEGKYLVSLLRGVCDNCYTRWGWYDRALYPFLKQEYIPQPVSWPAPFATLSFNAEFRITETRISYL